MNVYLASKSKRRQQILQNLGISFKNAWAEIDESDVPDGLSPRETVKFLAKKKLEAAKNQHEYEQDDLVICADTVVSYDGMIMGKPHSKQDAFKMLTMLSGDWHSVYTGVALSVGDITVVECEKTRVKFREITSEEMEKYVETDEPMDKAGGYGIQGIASIFAEHIEGDFFNIVGLPVCRLGIMLKENFDIEIMDLIK